jgi:hypothetical protein
MQQLIIQLLVQNKYSYPQFNNIAINRTTNLTEKFFVLAKKVA